MCKQGYIRDVEFISGHQDQKRVHLCRIFERDYLKIVKGICLRNRLVGANVIKCSMVGANVIKCSMVGANVIKCSIVCICIRFVLMKGTSMHISGCGWGRRGN
jgi:hypothetical protein